MSYPPRICYLFALRSSFAKVVRRLRADTPTMVHSRAGTVLSAIASRASCRRFTTLCPSSTIECCDQECCDSDRSESRDARRVQLLIHLCLIGIALLTGCESNKQETVDPDLIDSKSGKWNIDLVFDDELDSSDSLSVLPVFADVATDRNLNFTYHSDESVGEMNMPEVFGAGVACFDFDLDGWCDLALPDGRSFPLDQRDTDHPDRLFRNHNGRFQDITDHCRLAGFEYSHGCGYGDINGDGFEDLIVANFGSCDLYLNQGDGTFLRQDLAVLREEGTWWMVALVFDADFDRLPDLFLIPYVDWTVDSALSNQPNGPGYPGPNDFPPLKSRILKNEGNGQWRDVTEAWGLGLKVKALAAAGVDLDNDLKCELFVANDSIGNHLLTTSRDLRFDPNITNASRTVDTQQDTPPPVSAEYWVDISEISGTAAGMGGTDEASMSATVADFDRNGLPDLLVTNYYARSNSLYANRGNLNFRDTTYASRMDKIGRSFLSFGASPIDYDLNGTWDLIIANGHVLGPNSHIYKLTHQLLRNVDGTFVDISSRAGRFFNEVRSLGRSTATLDMDNDGDTDLVMTHVDRPVSLLENQTPRTNQWISLEVADPQHHPLEGGRIEIVYGDQPTTVLPIMTGGSYLSDSQKRWTVGLGPPQRSEAVCQVAVHWNDGTIDRWDLAINQSWRLLPRRPQRLADSEAIKRNP